MHLVKQRPMNATEYYTKNRHFHYPDIPGSPIASENSNGSLRGFLRRPSEPEVALGMVRRYCRPSISLDIGCSNLDFLKSLRSLGATCFGVDIVPFPAWKRNKDINTAVLNLDQESLPFPDRTFTFISMLMVLEHLFDPFHAVQEASRVLRPGGRLMIAVPNIAYLRITIPLLFGRFPVTSSPTSWDKPAWDGYHLHNFTRDRLEWLVTEFAGLRPITCKGSGRLWRLRSLCPSVLTGDLILLAHKSRD